jgi:1-acyl-sn-glycerol-3-phosphate acyltransferase
MPKKELEPIRILIDDYDSRTPSDLLSHELRQSRILYGMAAGISRVAIRDLVVDDPHHILSQTKGLHSVHAPRHFDYFDIPAIGLALKRTEHDNPYYVTMAELLGVPESNESLTLLLRQEICSFLIGRLGSIPLDRYRSIFEGVGNKKLLKMAKFVISELNKSLVVAPEGGLASSRQVGDVSTGAADIARMTGSPLIIWGLAGTEGATSTLLKERTRPSIVAHVHEVIEPNGAKITQEDLRQKLQAASDAAFELWEAA